MIIFAHMTSTNINVGTLKLVRNQGMPSYRHHDNGNLYVRFDVKFPASGFTADPAAFEQLKAILPASDTTIVPPKETMTEQVDFEDIDPAQQARAQGATGMDEDDEEGAGGERVQCASQ